MIYASLAIDGQAVAALVVGSGYVRCDSAAGNVWAIYGQSRYLRAVCSAIAECADKQDAEAEAAGKAEAHTTRAVPA